MGALGGLLWFCLLQYVHIKMIPIYLGKLQHKVLPFASAYEESQTVLSNFALPRADAQITVSQHTVIVIVNVAAIPQLRSKVTI